MDEDSKASEAQGNKGNVLDLADQFSSLNLRVDTCNQVVLQGKEVELSDNIDPKKFAFPAVVRPFALGDKRLLLVMIPPETEEYNLWVLGMYTGAAAESLCPPPKDEYGVFDPVALLRACKGLHVNDYTKQIITLTEGELLSKKTELKKLQTLQKAYKVLNIPAHDESADKADAKHAKAAGGGKAATKLLKAADKVTAKPTKATKLPKASGGLIGAKAADGSDGAVATAVQKAKAVLSAARELERANERFAKAVVAAGVGDDGKESKVSGGDATVAQCGEKASCPKLLKAVRPSAGGGKVAAGGGGAAVADKDDVVVVHPAKRPTHDGR